MKFALTIAIAIPALAYFYLSEPSESPQDSLEVDISEDYRCKPGYLYRSSLNFNSEGTLTFKGSDKGQAAPYTINWSGIINRYCLRDSGEQSVFFTEVKIDNWQDNFDPKIGGIMRDDLSRGIFWQISPWSIRFKISDSLNISSANLWQLLALTTFRCGHGKQLIKRCREEIPQDSFDAVYKGIDKSWSKTFSWGHLESGINKATLRADQDQYILNVAQEQVDGIASYQGSLTIEIASTDKVKIDISKWSQLEVLLDDAKDFDYDKSNKVVTKKSPVEILGQTSYEDLRVLEKPTGNDFLKMTAWLELSDDNIKRITEDLIGTDFSENYKAWVKALAKLGSEEAQKSLIRLIEESSSSDSSESPFTMIALSMVDQPSLATEALFKSLLAEHGPEKNGKIAAYSLGITANQSPRSYDIIEYLRKQLSNSKDQDIPVYLRSLGNIKNPTVVDIIQPYLTHNSESIAIDALYALRFQESAFPIMLSALQSKSPSISNQAGRAIAFQMNQMNVKSIFEIWPKIANPRARNYLVSRITANSQLREESIPGLRNILEIEKNESIRKSIRKYLDSH